MRNCQTNVYIRDKNVGTLDVEKEKKNNENEGTKIGKNNKKLSFPHLFKLHIKNVGHH